MLVDSFAADPKLYAPFVTVRLPHHAFEPARVVLLFASVPLLLKIVGKSQVTDPVVERLRRFLVISFARVQIIQA